MARFEVTGPDGGRYEITAPDGASEQDVIAYVQQNAGSPPPASQGRSFAQPDLAGSIDVQGRADREIAAEPAPGPKPLAFGIPIIGPYLDEAGAAVASMPNTIAGVGPTYEKSLARIRARNKRAEAENPIQDTAGQLATGLTVGGPVLNKVFSPAASMLGNIVKGGLAGAGLGAVEGFGRGEGDVSNRLESAGTGGAIGGMFGAALPPALGALSWGAGKAADALSPTIARWRPNAVTTSEAMPQSAGAAINPTLPPGRAMPTVTSPEAAFYQRMANELSAANIKPGTIGQRLESSDVDAVGGVSPLALVDLDNSIQRLAGSYARQSKEVANTGQKFVAGRQTGITPSEGMPPNSGIPTRQFMEQPSPISPPAGMYERMDENVRSALQVPQRSAYRVDQDLVALQKKESGANYRATYDAAKGVNIAPAIDAVLQKWTAVANDPTQLAPIAKTIQRATNIFKTKAGTVSSLERFQDGKELLDEMISGFLKSPVGRNRKLGGELNKFKTELLDTVDNIPTVGALYKDARNIYSSSADMRDALKMGREALKDGADVSSDKYRAMTTGEQQMFRVGLADAVEREMARAKRGADVTQIFQKPHVQQLFMEVMPQEQAMRLGRNIQTENTTTRTLQEVFGNSKTQQRAADDEAFNQMSDVIDAIRSAKSATSPTDAGLRVLKGILDKVGGFRADEASVAAQKLFTADRGELDDVLKQIEARMGPSRAAHFKAILSRYNILFAQQAGRSVAPESQATPPKRPKNLPPEPMPRQP